MKAKLISGVIMAMTLVACTQEEVFDNGFGLKELKVEVEGYRVSSRVGFTDKDADFFWTKGDKIGVTTASTSTFQGMTLDGKVEMLQVHLQEVCQELLPAMLYILMVRWEDIP